MRVIRILSFLALAVAAASFAATTYVESHWNWRPVELSLPGPGLEVLTSFDIVTSGQFQIEAQSPVRDQESEVGLRELPPAECDLQVTLKGPNGFWIDRRITELHHEGRSGIDLYASDALNLPRRGEYIFRLTNRGRAQVFGDRGAMIALTRYEKPTEAYLQAVLLRGLGWCGLGLGLMGAAWSTYLEWRRKGSSVTASGSSP